MKSLFKYFIFMVIVISIFSGCSIVDQSTSSVSRTLGLGEEALPMEKGYLGLEVSVKEICMLDKIYVTEYDVYDQEENEIEVTGEDANETNLYSDYTVRFGVTDLDEISIGFLRGSEGGKTEYSYTLNGETTTGEYEYKTKYTGFKAGYKRLLSNPENPLRFSMYMSLTRFIFDSSGRAAKYDATSFETRAAILLGVNNDLHNRTSYPTIAIYHSSAYTERNETIPGIPLKRNPQSLGAELLLNADLGLVYSSINAGVEHKIAGSEDYEELEYYMGFKIGLKIGKK